MIRSDVFHERFDAGLRSALDSPLVTRLRGRSARYRLRSGAGDLDLRIRVNDKASALPYQPGEFWPELTAPETLRHPSQPDEGTVSWYGYTTEEQNAAILRLQRAVIAKVAAQDDFENDVWRQMRDVRLATLEGMADGPLEARLPHTALLYLDADDAHAWGALLGTQLPGWLERFSRAPETLATYMGRVHWGEVPA